MDNIFYIILLAAGASFIQRTIGSGHSFRTTVADVCYSSDASVYKICDLETFPADCGSIYHILDSGNSDA